MPAFLVRVLFFLSHASVALVSADGCPAGVGGAPLCAALCREALARDLPFSAFRGQIYVDFHHSFVKVSYFLKFLLQKFGRFAVRL